MGCSKRPRLSGKLCAHRSPGGEGVQFWMFGSVRERYMSSSGGNTGNMRKDPIGFRGSLSHQLPIAL